MMTPLFHVTLPDLDDNSEESHFAPLLFILGGMINLNVWHIQRAMKRAAAGMTAELVPPLYASGARYQEDAAGREDWRDVYAILDRIRTGKGIDCDNLICWRVAELRVAGIPAEPVIKWQHLPYALAVQLGYPADWVPKEGLWMVHCCVRWPDGTIEDTSKNLGMGGNYTNAA